MKQQVQKILDKYYEELKQEDITNRSHLIAILFDKRGRVKGVKSNEYKTHPLAKLWGYASSKRHAEFNVCNSIGFANCHGLSLLVFRILPKRKELTMAKPCEHCEELLDTLGLDKIYYTDWDGEICEL